MSAEPHRGISAGPSPEIGAGPHSGISAGPHLGIFLLPHRKRRAIKAAIEGADLDLPGASYGSFEDLLGDCRSSGGSLGRQCVEILGSRDQRAAARLAEDLGVAITLTRLLRDLRRDVQRKRVYIPAQELVRYHLHDDDALSAEALLALALQGRTAEPAVVAGFEGGDVGQLYALMRFQALRARDWLHRGAPLVLLLDRRSAAYVNATIGSCRRLLSQIEKRPDRALAAPVSLSPRERAWVFTRALLKPHRVIEQHPAERMP
jgi:15-cis-phytoene synthase